MKTLIIGNGEIGKALKNVLLNNYKIHILDKNGNIFECFKYNEEKEYKIINNREKYDIIHICFPYSEKFIFEVKKYQKRFDPKYTIIHSTVPIGTSRKCNAIHSPVIGKHPHLEESLITFTKYISGKKANEVADYFRRVGMKVYLMDKQEATELGKISQTTQYALNIEYIKNLKKECDKYNLSFSDVYTLFSQNYNEGYKKLGYEEYKIPLLVPIMNKQGGHCTISNCKIWNNVFTKFILKNNYENIKK
jgi:prephenate dehydrogenase